MGKRLIWSILALLFLTPSCEIFEATPVDGTYRNIYGYSVEIQHGRCVRAYIYDPCVSSSSDTTWGSTFSEGIQSSGYFPNYEYRYCEGEVSWYMVAAFDTYTEFTALLYMEHGENIICTEGLHFELTQQ